MAVVVRADACTQCGLCLDSCSREAIRLLEAPVIDGQTCFGCGACVNACPNRVLDLAKV
ncbi:MAG: 4Fe-4S binding protein [Actinobacteria bacterium]|nr:4Fe-4S binding protein [Actinomycetota bacterium]